MNALNIQCVFYYFLFKLEKVMKAKEQKLHCSLSISLQEEKGPCFYLTLYWFSSSHRSSKPLLPPFFSPKKIFSGNLIFSAKVYFKGKKIPDDHNGWQRMPSPFSLGGNIIYLQNNWEIQAKGKFVLDRRENIKSYYRKELYYTKGEKRI